MTINEQTKAQPQSAAYSVDTRASQADRINLQTIRGSEGGFLENASRPRQVPQFIVL